MSFAVAASCSVRTVFANKFFFQIFLPIIEFHSKKTVIGPGASEPKSFHLRAGAL